MKKLTAYERAEVWMRIGMYSRNLSKAAKKQDLVMVKEILRDIKHNIEIIENSNIADSIEKGIDMFMADTYMVKKG